MYLHVIEYIQPFTNDNREAPREDRPITIHQNSSINAPIHPLEKSAKFSKEERDPIQSDDEKRSHLACIYTHLRSSN